MDMDLDAVESPVLVEATYHNFRQVADELVGRLLDRHEHGIVLTADRSFEELEDEYAYLGLETDRLRYIDLVSDKRGLDPGDERVQVMTSPTAYNDISIALTDALDAVGDDAFLVIDSFTAWLLYGSVKQTGNFVKKLTDKAVESGAPSFIMVLSEQIDEEVIERFMTFCGSDLDMTDA